MSISPALEVSGLTVRYGGVIALEDVTLQVGPRQIVGLIGPNGAGKTTFIDAVTGYARPSAGEVRIGGKSIARLPAHKRTHLGISRTFQTLELFEDLTVLENVLVPMEARTSAPRRGAEGTAGVTLASKRGYRDLAGGLLERVGLEEAAHTMPSSLSLGQRKLCSVARALSGSPSILLLDEPAAGLDTDESKRLGETLQTFRDDEVSLLLVDHDMDLVLEVSDFVYVLDFGRVIADGTPKEIRTNQAVISAYLGTE